MLRAEPVQAVRSTQADTGLSSTGVRFRPKKLRSRRLGLNVRLTGAMKVWAFLEGFGAVGPGTNGCGNLALSVAAPSRDVMYGSSSFVVLVVIVKFVDELLQDSGSCGLSNQIARFSTFFSG